MSALPEKAFTVTGGCYCQAIRYTISVPELSARPKHESDYGATIGEHKATNNYLPRVEIDHCSMCRRIQGSVAVVWIMALRSWVTFSLSPRTSDQTTAESKEQRLQPPTMDVLNGTPEVLEKSFVSKFSSSEDVDRVFCSKCGTHLTFRHNKPEESTPESKQSIDLTFGSLDPEFLEWECLKPTDTAYEEFGIGWVRRWLKGGEMTLLEEW